MYTQFIRAHGRRRAHQALHSPLIRKHRTRAKFYAILCLVFFAPACLRFDCVTFDSSCRTEALLLWMLPVAAEPACGVYAPGRVSVASDGSEAIGGNSQSATISANGRYVLFASAATNLVAGDTNGFSDVFLHDRATGETTRVSVANGGGQATGGESIVSAISDDGRYVGFLSQATNLVAGDTNGMRDAFVHDRDTGETTRVSVSTGGTEGDQPAFELALSGDGRYVAFSSSATNMVAGDTNGVPDIFLHDRQTGITTRESVASGGVEGTGGTVSQTLNMSQDGTIIVFMSDHPNLVAGDTNALHDIFIRDRTANTTTRASVATGGGEASGGFTTGSTVSGDGRIVTFYSAMTDLVAGDTNALQDVFVHERDTVVTTRVSVASDGAQSTGGSSFLPVINSDGRYVAFVSTATNLVATDTNAVDDIFVHDRQAGSTSRVTLSLSDGAQANGNSNNVRLSRDCPYLAFQSAATNLVTGDTNGQGDIFVFDRP